MRLQRYLPGVLLAPVILGLATGCREDRSNHKTPPNNLVEASLTDPVGVQRGEVSLRYTLADDDSDLATIEVHFSTDGGASFESAQATEFSGPGSESDGVIDLATSPLPGTAHTFVWDTLADLGQVGWLQVQLRVTPFDSEPGIAGTTAGFPVDNVVRPPPSVAINPIPTPQNGAVRILYTLFDGSFLPAAITVEYSIGAGPFLPATELSGLPSEGTTGLRTAPPPAGAPHNFFWDTMADGIGLNPTPDSAVIRITPQNMHQVGLPDASNPFDVNNFSNTPPSVVITQLTPGPDPTRDVDILYDLIDADSDRINVTAEFSTDAGATFAPATLGSGSDFPLGMISSPAGINYLFVWNTLADVGATDHPQCRVRITPSDGRTGTPGETADFPVRNADTTPPEVSSISDAATNTLEQRIVIEFTEPLDPATVILGTGGAATFGVVQDNDTTPGGNPCGGLGAGFDFSELPGQIVLEDQDRRVIFLPGSAFLENREVRLVLTSGITDMGANPLFQDPSSPLVPSDPLSLDCVLSPQVFENRFLPGAIPDCARFLPDSGADIWLYDFDFFGTFEADLGARGLQTSTAADPENLAARDRVVTGVLSTMSAKYNRDPTDGSPIPGAWRISFVCSPPPGGVLGVDYSRMCVGMNLLPQGILGTAWLDPGNQKKEDDCRTSNPALGVFSGGIDGTNSALIPPLAAGELRFLDGTYTLGSGTPAEDARFLAIGAVIFDWSHAIGTVGAHETGHSVGLGHDDGGSLNIMRSSVSHSFLSNTNTRFCAANAAILDTNLGVVP